MTLKKYAVNLLTICSVILNCVLLFGERVETFSRRSARARVSNRRWGVVCCTALDWLFTLFGDRDHCQDALDRSGEIYRAKGKSWPKT